MIRERAGGNAPASDVAEKIIGIAALFFSIELVLFKFMPDLSTAVIQHGISPLADFKQFELGYMTPGSVHYARFLGNHILYSLAHLLAGLYHSTDPRLHPLRVAAGILTPLYAYLGTHLMLADRQASWRYFFAPYALLVVMSLYVFYPADMPSLALLSMAIYCLLHERLAAALLLTLAVGLFRESAFHMVALVGLWAVCDHRQPVSARVSWLGAFAMLFAVEYLLVRHLFPGPVPSNALVTDPHELFLGRGVISLTTLCSVGLAALFPIAARRRADAIPSGDWRRRFFVLNCWMFPAWLVFYRVMSGNLTEFRLLSPALLPCIYGIVYGAQQRQRAAARHAATQSGM